MHAGEPDRSPDASLVRAGLCAGLAIAATEVSRYTALWTVELPSPPAKYPLLLLFLCLTVAVVAVLQRKRRTLLPFCVLVVLLSVAGVAMRAFCNLGLLGEFGHSNAASILAGFGLEAPYLLMVVVASTFLRLKPHAAMRAAALGITFAGLLQLLVLAFAQSQASYVLVALFAPASLFLLYRANSLDVSNSEEEHFHWSASSGESARPALYLVACALCMVMLASIVVYFIHAGWSEARSAGASPAAIQLFAGLGVTLAGCLLCLIAPFLRRKDVFEFCFLVIAPMLAICLCLVGLVDGAARIALLVPLNVAYASLLFLVWMFAFVYPCRLRPEQICLLAFFVKRAGVLVCPMLISLVGAMGGKPIWVAFWALVLLIFLDVAHYTALHASQPVSFEAGEGQVSTGADLYTDACAGIASEYGLTIREAEVLLLLGRGRTAAHISQMLEMSLATARTHIQHIYRKVGVSSQQTLLDVIEDRAVRLGR